MKHAALRYILLRRSTSRNVWLRCSKVTSDSGYPTQGILKGPDFQRVGCSALSENTAPKVTSRFCKTWLPSFALPNSHAFLRWLGPHPIRNLMMSDLPTQILASVRLQMLQQTRKIFPLDDITSCPTHQQTGSVKACHGFRPQEQKSQVIQADILSEGYIYAHP